MRRNEMEMNGTLEQGNECETERSQLDRNIREEERSLPLLYVYILVPYSLYVQRGFREASNGGATTTSYNYGGEHDYYDSAWGCTKTPWWGSGWRPHSPPLEMISVATRSREPQHVSCPSQSELNSLLDFSLCIRFSLQCVFSLKIGYFGEHERVYSGCGKGKSENFSRCILIYPFFWITSIGLISLVIFLFYNFLELSSFYIIKVNIGRVIIMGEKTFNLTWNNHLANLSGLFEGLYKSGSLTDTTLACQGGMLRAHRLVLAACSPYFERVFKEHYGEQPILILKGVAVEEMECLLDFMYRGSIDVAEEHLPSLIKTATDLEIRGLSGEQRNQENSRSPYTRVETRMQRCHIETRVHTTEYLKEPSVIPFLPKQSSIESLEDHIKVEEIEVEDDPMVIDGHEDTFDEPLRSAETQIRRMPPPMYKRETRFKGQKRVSVGRSTRNNDVLEFRSKERIVSKEESTRESYEDSSNTVKSDSNFNNASADPTVPDIQMNDDLQERDESLDSSKSTDDNPRLTIKKKGDCPTKRSGLNEGKDARPMQTNAKAQYKPFSCDLCTLAFTRASHLARHRRVHTGERPFACSICPRMFARQDKLKQHLDSHLQWPKRKNNLSNSSCQSASSVPAKGKRGRPRKQVNLEQSAMEEILKFGEFSSLLNKSHSANATDKNEDFTSVETKIKEQEEDAVEEGNEDKDKDINKDKDNYGCQVENGQDIV